MTEPYRIPPPKEGDDDIVTIGAHSSAVEAEMAREYLKHHGITSFVQEAAGFNPAMNEAMSGSRVLVRSADAALARSLLTQVEKVSTTDEDDGVDEVRCPRCELSYCFFETLSDSVSSRRVAFNPLLAFPALLFGSFGGKRWRCHKCFHVWDDPKEGPARMTPLGPDDPRPVFRLRRNRAGSGVMLGLMLMAFAAIAASAPGAPPALLMLPLLLPFVGYAIGRSIVTDVCSAPGCRTELPPDTKECPVCRGAIAGVIRAAHDHYTEAAVCRRELAELRERDERRARAKKRPGKKPKASPITAKPAS